MRPLVLAIHDAFHEPDSLIFQRVETMIWSLILVSVGLLALAVALGPDAPGADMLEQIDQLVLKAFGVELALRVATFRPPSVDFYRASPLQRARMHVMGRLRFLTRPLLLVDLVTVLAVFPALRGLRALRLLRLLRTRHLLRYSNPFAGVARAFEENALLFGFGLSVLGTSIVLGGVSLFLVERVANPGISTVADGLWWAIVTVSTVGFGDITPSTGLGRLIGAAVMVAGLFNIALFAGIVGQSLLVTVLTIREEQFRMSTYVDHVVVCGYEPGARSLLDRLADELDLGKTAVVLFAPGDRPRELPPEFLWISGDPTKESELDKVRMAQAGVALIVGDRRSLPQQADATTLLIAFTIRRYLKASAEAVRRERPLYLLAEILDAENVEHAYAAGVDEAIETTRIGFSLLAHAVQMPGSAQIIGGIADVQGYKLFVGCLPPGWGAPLSFADLARRLRQEHDLLAIGIRRAGGRNLLNPSDDLVVADVDGVIYLAERPVLKVPTPHR